MFKSQTEKSKTTKTHLPDYINQQEMFGENRMVYDSLKRRSKKGKRKLNLCFQRFLAQSIVRKHAQATPPTRTNEWLNERVHRIVNQTDPITSYLNQG